MRDLKTRRPDMGVLLRQRTEHSGEASVRGHTVRVDRPEEKDGTDAGPMGGELILIGLGGCFMSNLLAEIRNSNAPISELELEVSSMTRVLPRRMTDFEIKVCAKCDEPTVLQAAAKKCAAVNTLGPVSIWSGRVGAQGM
ncbi:MAG: OsmC family protein [Gemmatimonadota bacterium]|nr:OsmC family protein [Gemmatimonadota bacterium]MDE2983134.1 OsmC family protein [Gemmatimonadota bacterium]